MPDLRLFRPTTPTRHKNACIEVDLVGSGIEYFTVVDYDAIQRKRENQPLWGRRAPAVEELTTIASSEGSSFRIIDLEQYDAQMRSLLGLD